MKIKHITKPNKKGQIVIPKEIRKELDIDSSAPLNISVVGNSIHIHPVKEVVANQETESSYLDILNRTQSTWSDDN